MSFKVSVVIPVYNAEKFIERSIRSALEQPEVAEILVVDDGYPDESLEIIKDLMSEDARIKLFQHPNGQNLGAGASRNVGLENAKCDYIALLDADDFFLPNRFRQTKSIFEKRTEVSAVYEPVGVQFQSEEQKVHYARLKSIKIDEADGHLSYPKVPLEGEKFFESMIIGGNGSPCTDGITFRKEILRKTGYFNTSLELHQDMEFFIRLSYYGVFTYGGHLQPIAIRQTHLNNRISKRNAKSKYLYNRELYQYWHARKISDHVRVSMLKKYVQSYVQFKIGLRGVLLSASWRAVFITIRLLVKVNATIKTKLRVYFN